MQFLTVLALAACVAADGTGHHHAHHEAEADPNSVYGAPAPAYDAPAPAYDAPAPAYDAPAPSYAAPAYEAAAPAYDSYGSPVAAPVQEYQYQQEYVAPTSYQKAPAAPTNGAFGVSRILSILPYGLALLVAIIVGQLFSPLLSTIFETKYSIISDIVSEVGSVFAERLEMEELGDIFSSFGEARSASGLNSMVMDRMAMTVYNAIKKYQS